jgi:hypothetical protein
MSTNTRIIAAAIALTSMLAVMTSGTVAVLDRDKGAAPSHEAGRGTTTLRAAIETQWLSPSDGRRSLEARSAALTQWLRARGGSVRVVSSSAQLRTHAADGSRLPAAQARFERVLEIQVPRAVAVAQARSALFGPDASVAISATAGT